MGNVLQGFPQEEYEREQQTKVQQRGLQKSVLTRNLEINWRQEVHHSEGEELRRGEALASEPQSNRSSGNGHNVEEQISKTSVRQLKKLLG